jgi:hypothetical protein
MKKSLLATNPYLRDPAVRERSLARNVESSSAVEGIWVKRDATSGRFISTKSAKGLAKAVKKTSR